MFKQLIFDCDGVLVDTEIIAAEVMTKAFAQCDIHVTVEDYLTTYTGKTISSIFNSLLSPEQLQQINLKEFTHQCDVDIYDQLRPVKGMQDVVRTLPFPKAVVSNSSLWQVKKAVKHIGLEDIFNEKFFSSEMVPNPKPWPDIYLHAAKTLEVSPEHCLVVEDSKSGVKAAVDAGMTVIGFTGASHIRNGHGEILLEIGASHVASNPDELKTLIGKLTA
ncbi:HAD family hydrolase [Fulvivirga kasyanovii]|uniref:HAD family phosphatase n=1 Tax=Fulvivirga kasyanovii TaxID=396812 RepID=A0ABW9RQ30_9BACT|nr:HAD family phosphatase [Fulvivirga kasyanovii]MTI25811.1 HAD family phosphatase [Fulvivirga kasyanovii]